MMIHLRSVILVLSIALLSVGCTGITKKYQSDEQLAEFNSETGVIVGTVTAPFAAHYHETVRFEYRKLDEPDKYTGTLTSGMQHYNFLIGIPSCKEVELPRLCGRLFVIALPAGNYEIYRAEVMNRDVFQSIIPAVFTVSKSKVNYLGNIDVDYCMGMVTRHRGNILGADVSIKDEYERDVALIREHYSALQSSVIEKKLLADHSWRWRVSWTNLFAEPVEPYDWGECRNNGGNIEAPSV